MTQEESVLIYMREHKGITSSQAFRDLGITRLSAKIFNLKKQGHVITGEMKRSKNRQGKDTYFKKYILEE